MTEPAVLAPPPLATAAPSLADLVLLRLLPAAKSVPPADLRRDLGAFFRAPPTADAVAAAVGELRAEGYVTARGQAATAAGRARALQFLGIDKLPPRATWRTVKAKYLVPRALGLAPDDAGYAKADASDKLAAFLLKRELGLPESVRPTLPAVVNALLCRELGHPQFTDLNALIRAKLGEAVGGEPMSKADAAKVLPRVKLDVAKLSADALHAAVLRGALGGAAACEPEPVPAPVAEEPFDLEAFAHTVNAVARRCPTGRFGGYKVFISHVWEQLRDEPRFAPLGLAGFKAKLVEAHRADRLTLVRADLVQLMDPADVRASEVTYLTAAFHFILVEGS